MEFSQHFKSLAHAYLIQGDKQKSQNDLIVVLEDQHGVSSHGNPDFWAKQFVTFNIEDARDLNEQASRRKSGEGKRVFIINADAITREASNALLKSLEEPGEDTHFFIILPSLKRVLPTIISRTRSVIHSIPESSDLLSAEKFLKEKLSGRMKMIKEMLLLLDKEEVSRADIQSFIEETVRAAYAKKPISAEVATVASYATDQSASLKMILEYLAISL